MSKKILTAALTVGGLAAAGALALAVNKSKKSKKQDDFDFDITKFSFPEPEADGNPLDDRIYQLSQQYTELALTILKEAIRIPADFCDKDSLNGTSNHEGQRLEYLKERIIEIGAVFQKEDVKYDEFGNLVWTVTDPNDPIPLDQRKVIYLDGHSDTVYPLRDQWQSKLGAGIDCYNGMTDPNQVNEAALRSELNYLPDRSKWSHLVFGRGSADQLQGVISQIIATKILVETVNLGSLSGCIVRSIATIAEEDNDGGSPMYILRKTQLEPHEVPDCVIITEGTGNIERGPCGIYIGQRGRCQVEVEVIGKSCHGSMPNQGINPFEWGAAIIAEAAEVANTSGFKSNKFLGAGTRTASWSHLDTPSDCAVPAKFVFRFDRRMTRGEDADLAVQEIKKLRSVQAAEAAGCQVNIRIPRYEKPSWKGVNADNDANYMGWITHPNNPVVKAAVEAYKRTVSPNVEDVPNPTPDDLRKKPRVDSWIFSTDGVGYPLKKSLINSSENSVTKIPLELIEKKKWIEADGYVYPPMFGIGAGYEHHCHKLGEYLHADHLWVAISTIARFPSLFKKYRDEEDQ